MLKKITSALLLGAMLVFGAGAAYGQVTFDVRSSNGNDSLYVGIPGSIIFDVNAAGQNLSAITMPISFDFGGAGNCIGPVTEAPGPAQFLYSAATSVMENKPFNAILGNDFNGDPDTLLWGALDFNGAGWDVNGELARITFTPTHACVITVDQSFVPPANVLGCLDQNASDVPFTWGGPYTIEVVVKPNEPPTCSGVTGVTATTTYGGTVTAHVNASDPDASPAPLSYFVASAVNSNGTGPNNPMTIDAGGNFSWLTSNANNDDVGTWVVQIGVTDGLDTVYCPEFTFVVGSETPYCLAFVDPGLSPTDNEPGDNTVNVIGGQVATICIDMLQKIGEQCVGGFDLLICYDNSMLTLLDVKPGDAILDWEFFTYRIVSTLPAKIRLVGIKDMNNSKPSQAPCNPEGHLACLRFKTTLDQTFACQKAPIRFCWWDCGDNTLSSEDGNTLYIVGANAGGIVDVNGTQLFGQTPDPFGFNAGIVYNEECDWGVIKCRECVVPFVCFHNGGIRIQCPGEYDDRGDINLNGLAYEIADAVLYSNYFISGSSVLDPTNYMAQIAASDVNGDGSPLTVADLVYLIRVITGDALPVPDDYVGPKVASVVGTLDVVSAQKGQTVSVSTKSDQDLGAALFVFKYENTDISSVSVLGRASKMDVSYTAENGELRVLVYNIQDRAKIVAGSGDILSVSTLGAGKVELQSVEAASFMGGNLETNVAAKIIPTEYALKQNYPNPFNPSTSMALDLPEAANYKLTIYNIAGQVVKTYAGHSEAGTLTITWDGTNSVGGKVASGVYFYRAEAGQFNSTRKMVLMK
jgi:hypothetical protein